MKTQLAIAALLSASMLVPTVADACSRVVYLGPEGQTITGRTMDWVVPDIDTNLWLVPRGTRQTSNTKNPLTWTAKYGSVAAVIYNGASADGMNEKGLVANLLYLLLPLKVGILLDEGGHTCQKLRARYRQ